MYIMNVKHDEIIKKFPGINESDIWGKFAFHRQYKYSDRSQKILFSSAVCHANLLFHIHDE